MYTQSNKYIKILREFMQVHECGKSKTVQIYAWTKCILFRNDFFFASNVENIMVKE